MEVVSPCGLPVGSIIWQTWSGAVVLSVVCKATFLLRAVESRLAEKQEPIYEADRTFYDDPRESLQIATDLVPFKRRPEILVVGHALAPYAVPVRTLKVRFATAGIDKSIEIFVDRVFTHTGQLREGLPFAKVPLQWKYASGGVGTSNPVGIRLDGPPDVYGQRLAPRMQPPGLRVTQPTDVIPIVGTGPIAPTWPDRLHKLHHHAHTWDHQRWNERPLPRDIDTGYFNAAPLDQQVEVIRADERVVLENLHPDLPYVATNLSAVVPEGLLERPGRATEVVPFVCDTMWIDADRGTCSLSWRARIILESAYAPGRLHVNLAKGEGVAPAASAGEREAVAAGPGAGQATSAGAAAPVVAPMRAPPAPPPWVPGAPPDRFPIERCAAIAASIACRSGDTVKILAENNLSDEDWDTIEHHWSQVLKHEATQGETMKLGVYDRAYVLRLEEERGPITPEEYARLALSQDRDRAALTRALRDFGLPWGASQRIQRVYAERMAGDPGLAARVREAMNDR